jgi:hypothetical protein
MTKPVDMKSIKLIKEEPTWAVEHAIDCSFVDGARIVLAGRKSGHPLEVTDLNLVIWRSVRRDGF